MCDFPSLYNHILTSEQYALNLKPENGSLAEAEGGLPASIREVLGVKANAKLPSNASRACRLDAHSFFRCFSASLSGPREIGMWLLFAPKPTPIMTTKYILEIANVANNYRAEKNS